MAVTRVVDASGRVIEYERRRPENSVYYRIVQEHIQTVFSQAEENGSGYPAHVKREFERFLSCGVLAAGFARIQCAKPGCTFERLVAYSCYPQRETMKSSEAQVRDFVRSSHESTPDSYRPASQATNLASTWHRPRQRSGGKASSMMLSFSAESARRLISVDPATSASAITAE